MDVGLAVWVSLRGIVYLGFFVQFALANNAAFCTLNYMVRANLLNAKGEKLEEWEESRIPPWC